MRIACIGGGPGGVFFAVMLRQLAPGHEVVVIERNRADSTFGFGVVFSDATLSNLGEADPILRERLGVSGKTWEAIEVRLKGETLRCGGNGMAAIARKRLLGLLYQRAEEVGVDLVFQREMVNLSDLEDFDLVVGSDGANSILRGSLAAAFEPNVDRATAKFIWFGTTYRFEGLTFLFEKSSDGVFAVHGYPFDEHTGTFIVETDEQTWRSAGMDCFDVSQPSGVSDIFSKRYLESLFSEQIGGERLLDNNSRWSNFKTIRNKSWHSRKFVLLGDSAHTAHFSVGSGTKMAMEDAAALAESLALPGIGVEEALSKYESVRRPSVEGIQASAGPSLAWWENFGKYYSEMEPAQFVYHFLTRAISGERVTRRDPDFVSSVMQWWVGKFGEHPFRSPFDLSGKQVSGRLVGIREMAAGPLEAVFTTASGPLVLPLRSDPHSQKETDPVLLEIPALAAGYNLARTRLEHFRKARPSLLAIKGGTQLQRTMLSEEARLVWAIPTMVISEVFDPDAALTSVLSGRCDFAGVTLDEGFDYESLQGAMS
ncbi:MAG: FAD-dependent monooxygenase [Actinomycetota bacterium]|nr:FAD-dependent monooxygenase [Actinomycetota bacterium]